MFACISLVHNLKADVLSVSCIRRKSLLIYVGIYPEARLISGTHLEYYLVLPFIRSDHRFSKARQETSNKRKADNGLNNQNEKHDQKMSKKPRVVLAALV